MKIVFTIRAFVSLLSETAERVSTETGGIFLGHRSGDTWYVIEALDPGPKSIFQVTYFEYDQHYVTHLSNKIARLYKKPLQLIGLWHRHPGSFDKFSLTDNGTNREFASLHSEGAISALVNIDPDFRLTIYHVSLPLKYCKIGYEIGDNLIPQEYMQLNEIMHIKDFLAGNKESQFVTYNRMKPSLPNLNYSRILTKILNGLNSQDITEHVVTGQIKEYLDDNAIDSLIVEIEKDLEYLSKCGMEITLQKGDNFIRFYEKGVSKNSVDFYAQNKSDRCILAYKGRFYLYTSGMFQTIIEDIVSVSNMKDHNYKINKEYIECSISKLKRK